MKLSRLPLVNIYVNTSIFLLGIIVIYALLGSTIFSDGTEGIDDITLFNPIYNYLHTGKLVYPAHGYPDSVSVHPPMHYQVIAWLMRLGFSKKIAQSFLLIVFVFGIIGWSIISRADAALRIGILFAFFWLLLYPAISIRPDYTITTGILFGYILLYESSIQNYRLDFLIMGTILVSVLSIFHYYAWPANAGILVILFFLYKDQVENVKKKMVYVIFTCSIILLFYFLIVFIPDINNINRAFSENNAQLNIINSISNHFALYNWLGNNNMIASILILASKTFHIPIVVFSIILAFLFPKLGRLVWLSIPFSLCLLFFAQHKNYNYIHIEIMISIVCIVKLICVFFELILGQWWSIPILVVTIILPYNYYYHFSKFYLNPVPQAELARWCGKQMINKSNIIAANNGCWYISGANSYRIVLNGQMRNTLTNKINHSPVFLLDSKDMCSNIQAAALEWRIKNKLNLYGFFYASGNIENPYLLYSDSIKFIKGFAYFGNRQLWSYKHSESDSLYLSLILLPIDSILKTTTDQPPFFHTTFYYSMKDEKGNEIYTGSLKGKKLIWGVFSNIEMNEIKSNQSCKLIDLLPISAKIEEIPKTLSELIWQKPAVKITCYYINC